MRNTHQNNDYWRDFLGKYRKPLMTAVSIAVIKELIKAGFLEQVAETESLHPGNKIPV